mgnify:CR=1 FL=1
MGVGRMRSSGRRGSKSDAERPPSIALVVLGGGLLWCVAGLISFDLSYHGDIRSDRWNKRKAIRKAAPEEVDDIGRECKLRAFAGFAYLLTGMFVMWKTHMGVLICSPKPGQRIEPLADTLKSIIGISTVVVVVYVILLSGIVGLVNSFLVHGLVESIGTVTGSRWSAIKKDITLAIMASALAVPLWWLWATLHIVKEWTLQQRHSQTIRRW